MNTEKSGFSTSATFIIAVLLVVPFLIRSLAPALEPYPAILLPLGIGIFDIEQNEIDVQATQILAQNERNEWVRIEPARFLDPIPPYYIYNIAENKFGLVTQDRKEIKTAFWGRVEVPRKPVTDHDVVETEQWIRDRLRSLGFRDSVVRLRKSIKTIDLETDSIRSETILEETDFVLD